jgi:hypothetical protein
MSQALTPQTFQAALDTMNLSIEQHKDALFFQALLQACDSMGEDELMGVAIYRNAPESPHDFHTIRMRDGQFHLVEYVQDTTRADWRVSEDHLRDLANNRSKYIDHPEKLSLNWLAERVVAMTP